MTEPDHPSAQRHAMHASHAYRPVRIMWWIYFALISVYWLLAVFSMHSVLDVLQMVFWAVGLVGLFGYLRRMAIGWWQLWGGYLVLFTVWVAVNIVNGFMHAPPGNTMASLAAAVVIVLVFGPAAWALSRYALRCPDLWRASR